MTTMYQSYFGLVEAPFSIAPDPRYLYMSLRHQEALAALLFGLNSDGGFVLLTGEIGAGKTTICRCLLEQVPGNCDVAYIFNPKLTVLELLSSICDEFGIQYPKGNTSIKLFVDFINAFLLDAHAAGRSSVLIIDEAQNLSADVLEQMRLLTNLETHKRKLLQIILLGQPELAVMLDKPGLRQLAQRVVARYHLGPLNKGEVGAYVRHRLEVSGAQRHLIPDKLMGMLYRMSSGIPRVINVLCDRALLGTYVQGKEAVDRATLSQAGKEVFSRKSGPMVSMPRMVTAVLFLLLAAGLTAFLYPPQPAGIKTVVSAPKKIIKPVISAVTAVSAEAVAETKPAVILPDILAWPDSLPVERSKVLAYAALFDIWGATYKEGDDFCRQAASQGLRCRMARGGLEELRQLNRPAILSMTTTQGHEFFATLQKLEVDSATFAIGDQSRSVSLEALAFQWSGRYALLLRPVGAASKNILFGATGADVEKLDQDLAHVQGRPANRSSSLTLDAAMRQQLKQFQLAQGLVPDGAAGPQTLARLESAADRTAPRLLTERTEK